MINDDTDSETKSQQLILDRTVKELLEHFDSIQILATNHRGDKDITVSFSAGAGNWYARLGRVVEWLAVERGRAEAHGSKNPGDHHDE